MKDSNDIIEIRDTAMEQEIRELLGEGFNPTVYRQETVASGEYAYDNRPKECQPMTKEQWKQYVCDKYILPSMRRENQSDIGID